MTPDYKIIKSSWLRRFQIETVLTATRLFLRPHEKVLVSAANPEYGKIKQTSITSKDSNQWLP
jgi:hypothetical protein